MTRYLSHSTLIKNVTDYTMGKELEVPQVQIAILVDQRLSLGNLLAAEVYKYLTEDGVLKKYKSNTVIIGKQTDRELLNKALNYKQKGDTQ